MSYLLHDLMLFSFFLFSFAIIGFMYQQRCAALLLRMNCFLSHDFSLPICQLCLNFSLFLLLPDTCIDGRTAPIFFFFSFRRKRT